MGKNQRSKNLPLSPLSKPDTSPKMNHIQNATINNVQNSPINNVQKSPNSPPNVPAKININMNHVNNVNNVRNAGSPIPANSQSPNPTQSSLQQQQQMGAAQPTKTLINNALTQQAEFQKHQMMARHFVKQAEHIRQQKLQQIAKQAQQIYNQQTQQQQPHNAQQQNWWQRSPN